MPCYSLVVLARPDLGGEKLAALFRGVARVVYREHGQFRWVRNAGVRPLAFPVRAAGARYDEARWVEARFDVAPPALAAVAAAVGTENGVLQFRTLRADGPLARFSPAAGRQRLKRFSAAMRYNAELFDPTTLTTHAPGTWEPAGAASAAAPPMSAPAAPAEQLR